MRPCSQVGVRRSIGRGRTPDLQIASKVQLRVDAGIDKDVQTTWSGKRSGSGEPWRLVG
jgi:hypothetical protein